MAMNDFIVIYGLTITFVCVLAGLFCVYRYFLGTKMTKAADKLKSQMANIRRDYGDIEANPNKIVGDSLGEMGVKGMLMAVVPKQYRAFVPIFAPILEGFLSNPDNLKKILPYLDKIGIKLPESKSEEDKTIPGLL